MPAIDGWQLQHGAAEDVIRAWEARRATNTGVLTKSTPGLDFDILNRNVVQALLDDLAAFYAERPGEILVRTGNHPKCLVPFQCSEPFSKITLEVVNPDARIKGERIELLASGQQFIADGRHPNTHKPYQWTPRHISEVPRDALPYIDVTIARELFERFKRILYTHGYQFKAEPTPKPRAASSNGQASIEEIEAALKVIPNDDLSWDEWNRVGMAVWAATNGTGFDLFDAWSSTSSKYNAKQTAAKWKAITKTPPSQLTVATLFYLADQADPKWRDPFRQPPGPGPIGPEPPPHPGPDPSPVEEPPPVGDPIGPALPTSKSAAAWVGRQLQPRRYIAPDFLPFREVSLFNGHGGAGKTQLALQIAIAVVLGTDCFGFAIKEAGPVIFYSLEEEEQELQRRCERILEHLNAGRAKQSLPLFSLEALKDLHFICMSEEDDDQSYTMELGAYNPVKQIARSTRAFNELRRECEQIKPVLVILENATDLFPYSEMIRELVNQSMSIVRRIARKHNCAVLLLQHVSESSRQTGEHKTGSPHGTIRRAIASRWRSRLRKLREAKRGSRTTPSASSRFIRTSSENGPRPSRWTMSSAISRCPLAAFSRLMPTSARSMRRRHSCSCSTRQPSAASITARSRVPAASFRRSWARPRARP
jgi:hypothetical protein